MTKQRFAFHEELCFSLMKQDSISIGVVQEVGYSVVNQQLKKQLLRGMYHIQLLGAVSTFGVVKKKRKAPEDAVAAAIPKGTTAGLFCAIH